MCDTPEPSYHRPERFGSESLRLLLDGEPQLRREHHVVVGAFCALSVIRGDAVGRLASRKQEGASESGGRRERVLERAEGTRGTSVSTNSTSSVVGATLSSLSEA